MRQCESVWPEENRGKCLGIAALAGGGAEGRGSRRFSGVPYGFALSRLRAQAERRGRRTLECERRGLLGRGRLLLVRGSTLVGARAPLFGASARRAGVVRWYGAPD